MPTLRDELQRVINEKGLDVEVRGSKVKLQQKRKGKRSTGELTLRTLRWLVATRLREVEAGVSWNVPDNTEIGRGLLEEIDERLADYDGSGGPRGPSVNK